MAVGKNLMQLQGLSDQVLYGPFLPQIFIFLFIVHWFSVTQNYLTFCRIYLKKAVFKKKKNTSKEGDIPRILGSFVRFLM